MARTRVESAVVVRQKYFWPDVQLNIWFIIMLATAGTILGVNAEFMQIQSQMKLGTPWLFPYGVTVGALSIIFFIIFMILIAQRRLLPGVVMLLSFILLVLYITGIIETAIQLFGGPNVNNACQIYVNGMKQTGANGNTLAWMQQQNICQCWQAMFAFWIIGTVFLVWIMIMASQVNNSQYD